MDNNYIRTGLIVSFIFLFINDMTSKFIVGFVTGIFVSTKYDFKPYVVLIEDKISSIHKELESKREEINMERERSRVSDHSWGFNWPWSENDKKN